MTALDAAQQNKHQSRLNWGTRTIFLINGLGMSAWAPLVPFARDRLQLSGASLGALLLCLGIGSLAAMPVTGTLVARFGCRRVMCFSTLLVLMMMPLLATADSHLVMAAALMLFGAGLGMLDVAMNYQAVQVEQAADKPMMSGFHGFFSLGGILGAGTVSLLLSQSFTPLAATLVVMAVMLLLLLWRLPVLMNERLHQPDQPWLVIPRGWVAFLGLLCFILFLAEGAVLDWGALLLLQNPEMSPAWAGLGYAVFSVAMTLGRFSGDKIIQRFGRYPVMLTGALTAAAGMSLAVWLPWPEIALLAFLLVGFGLSNTVPMLFNAAGNQQDMPANLAISAMTTLGYAGILSGPALIGFISQWISLSGAFLAIALLLLAVAASARKVAQ
ncbi:putative MFS family arabinose efflux permease [Pantoea agglomerans]|jgi:predicted MFS family arabinose efflux permease|uniref:MFS transporter n=1 Tax=Pantoea TaxID=53335 RepID=UPI00025542BA|nr:MULTISPECIES: MFS transporter [Pantoea]KAF6681130.1 MFS transporter [Pantoea sp. EKM20T]KGD77006.1 MFS transporter [Pantoea agglomerans]MBA8863389.1 putative MFS family arabinose efflux permease [Pantoea agglomerans]MBA8890326.1 putative MFS family arabinose efflux permease [Pantoea agglomerans]MBD8142559.1 MFS transporter [Pantoea agglomerans]